MGKQKIHGVKHRNELNVVQKIIMWLFLVFFGVIMFLPLWNVLVVSTTTSLEASDAPDLPPLPVYLHRPTP